MKQILASLVLSFFLLSSANAGLFEYHMNGTLDSKIKNTKKDPDVIEQISSKSTPSYRVSSPRFSLSVNDLQFSRYSSYTTDQETIFANDYYKGGYNYKNSQSFYTRNGYYNSSDHSDMLRDELRRTKNELNFIDERKDDIYQELRNLDRFTSTYSRNLYKSLEKEYKYLEEREQELNDMIDDITQDILSAERNSSNSDFDYYFNEYGQRVYYTNSYNQNTWYDYDTQYYSCYKSNIRYDNCYYNSSYYDERYYNNYLQRNFINPDLEAVKPGRIYIK